MEYSFNVQIAKITRCADEAAFVHRIRYLTLCNEAKGRNFRKGKYWTYDSAQALLKIFDFWTPKQLRRIIKNCVELGLIETGSFAGNPLDRRTWYTLTDKAKEIYANGQMRLPEWANPETQKGKSTHPKGQMFNKEIIKETIKDLEEDMGGACAAPVRDTYGEFGNVLLSEDEYARLSGQWGPSDVQQEIEELSCYMASCGVRYKNHYATLSNWLRRRSREREKRAVFQEPRRVYYQEPPLKEW